MSSFALDEERFFLCCHLLLQCSEQLRDGWSWEVVQGSEEGYLRKTVLRSVPVEPGSELRLERSSSELQTTYDCSQEAQEQHRGQCADVPRAAREDVRGHSEEEDIDDGTCSVPESRSQLLHYEYHVLYSCSYNTPVLYFRVFTLEGKSLSLEEVWSSVHPNFRLRLQESPLDTISQQVQAAKTPGLDIHQQKMQSVCHDSAHSLISFNSIFKSVMDSFRCVGVFFPFIIIYLFAGRPVILFIRGKVYILSSTLL